MHSQAGTPEDPSVFHDSGLIKLGHLDCVGYNLRWERQERWDERPFPHSFPCRTDHAEGGRRTGLTPSLATSTPWSSWSSCPKRMGTQILVPFAVFLRLMSGA